MNRKWFLSFWCVFFVGFSALLPSALAQYAETTGTVRGTVKDASGAVVAGAEVTISGPALVASKTVTSDSAGEYRFGELPPGVYTVTVVASGFRKAIKSDIILETGRRLSINMDLEVGAVTEIVEVKAAAATLDTSTSKAMLSVTFSTFDVAPKPRGVLALLEWAPGSRSEPAQGGFQMDGASAAENTYAIEGQDTTLIQTGLAGVNPPTDFFKEVTVKSSGYEAEHSGAMGGVVNIVVKSGGPAWHGTGTFYYRSDILDAAPRYFFRRDPKLAPIGRFYNPAQTYNSKKDTYKILEPGFEIGGPAWKDRITIFGSYIPTLDTNTRVVNITNVNSLGLRSFTQVSNTYFAVGRADGRITNTLRASFVYNYAYARTRGVDRPAADDLDGKFNAGASVDARVRRADSGNVFPNNLWRVSGDWTATPKLVVAGGYGIWKYDTQDRGRPTGDRHIFDTSNLDTPTRTFVGLNGATVPLAFRGGGGFFDIPENRQQVIDLFSRRAGDVNASYYFRFLGSHTLKGGYTYVRLANTTSQRRNTSRNFIDWGIGFLPSTPVERTLCAPVIAANLALYSGPPNNLTAAQACRGNFGFYTVRDFQIRGDVASNNQGLFVQDSWNLGYGVTANVGIRFDREFLPGFKPGPNVINQPIFFNFADKVGPRIGAAWDVLRNGKIKVFGSWGWFYDIMKYELPRGSFGGDYWHDCTFTLDTADYTSIKPGPLPGGFTCNNGTTGSTPGTFLGEEDFRIPSNTVDPTCPADAPLCHVIDPLLQPVRQTEYVLGGEWAFNPNMSLEMRWARKRVRGTIEDVGILGPAGEEFLIVNPGQGSNFAQFPLRGDCAAPGDPRCNSVLGISTLPAMPKAVREYDGVEFRFNKRFTQNWFLVASYTWSRLFGNYSGLTNTDEDLSQTFGPGGGVGRSSPNVTRAFDEQTMMFNASGQPEFGLLPTDRPHTFKAFGGYRFNYWGTSTTIAANQQWYIGVPISSRLLYLDDAPFFAWDRGTLANITQDTAGNWVLNGLQRGSRSPQYSQTDFNITQEFKLSKTNEALRLGVALNILNLFNQAGVITIKDRTDGDRFVDFLTFEDPTCSDALGCASTSGQNFKKFFGGFDPIAEANAASLRLDTLYNKPLRIQSPRALRLMVRVSF